MKIKFFYIFLLFFPLLYGMQTKAEFQGKTFYSLGPGLAWQKSIYRGMNDKFIPIPAFYVHSDRFSFNGINASYKLYSSTSFTWATGLGMRLSGFSPDDSDYLKGMRKRKFQLNLSNSLEYVSGAYLVGSKLSIDINNTANGWEGEIFAGRRFRMGKFLFSGRLKAVYESQERSNLNYGVYSQEALPWRPYYKPGAALTAGADFSIIRNYGRNSFFLFLSIRQLSKKIVESPIVNNNKDISAFAGYSFKI